MTQSISSDLLLRLERGDGRGLRRALERALRDAIHSGRLAPGATLPASRVLARDLAVARSVVVEAYGQLVADGYLEARQGSGTRVRLETRPGEASPPRAPRRGDPARGLTAHFVNGIPDQASFPRVAWQRHYRAALQQLPDSELVYADPQGAPELRAALAEYLARVRGVRTTPEQMLVCGGFAQGLALVSRALKALGHGRIGVEDPCFGYHRHLIAHAGLEPVPLPVDDQGVDVSLLERLDLRAVFVSPAHSYPTGAVLSSERRAALVAWARRADAVVVEDDYDAEFRYDREPVVALQGLAPDRVVYGGSTSKTLSPLLRLGWLAVPEDLLHDVLREKFFHDMATGGLEQLALARFVESGDLTRHLRRVRPVYKRRRDAALRALAEHMPEATPRGVAAGLNLYVELPPGCSERMVLRGARERGVFVEGAAWHWANRREAPPALVLGYGAVGEAAIEAGIAALGAALRQGVGVAGAGASAAPTSSSPAP
jgi:GntR family transcriptional regulator / MocR family aminotransferase